MSALVTLVGYGRFGRALAYLLSRQGTEVVAVDPAVELPAVHAEGPGRAAFTPGSTVFISVPVSRVRTVLEELTPRLQQVGLVIDVSSVRAPADAAMAETLGSQVPWVGTHPLFGPSSLMLGERPLRVVVCPNPRHPGAAGRARALYERIGCEVIEEAAATHDRAMARTHALAFFIAKGMLDLDGDRETGDDGAQFVPPSFRAMQTTIDAVRSDAGHLFYAIERLNPYAEAARADLLAALTRVHDELAAPDLEPGSDVAALRIPDLGARAPELAETREHIDAVDRELLDLIARRAALARRVGQIKGEKSLPVRDPTRERQLLAARRAWAEALGLDPDGVAGLFERLLTLSRDVQSNQDGGSTY